MSGRLSLALAVCALSLGCGAHGSYANGVYRGDSTFRVEAPPSPYRQVDVEDQNDLAWVGDDGSVIQVNGSCDPSLDIPLPALTNHLLFQFTEREYLDEGSLVPLDGREALRTHVRAKLDGVPRELILVVTKKDACVYDFALVSAPGASFEAARPAFERVVASFASGAGR